MLAYFQTRLSLHHNMIDVLTVLVLAYMATFLRKSDLVTRLVIERELLPLHSATASVHLIVIGMY